MGLKNFIGKLCSWISSRVRIKKRLSPVASPRFMSKMSESLAPGTLAAVWVLRPFHFEAARKLVSGILCITFGSFKPPPKVKSTVWPLGGGALRKQTTDEET